MTDVDRAFSEPLTEGLLGLLAHDLRAPLAPISLAMSSLAEDAASSNDARELARIADAQGDKLRRLIDAALVSSGRQPALRLNSWQLGDVLRDAGRIHRAFGGDAEVAEPDVVVEGDRTHLRDAFANLMECGAGEGGHAIVECERAYDRLFAIVRCADLDRCAGGLRGGMPIDAMSAFLLGSKSILELHAGGLELTNRGLIAWLPVAPAV